MKVYVTILWWEDDGDRDFSYQIHTTKEKAQKTLEKWKQEEMINSWISEIYDFEELDNYVDTDDYFDCDNFDRRTTIWIEEKEIV